MNKILEIKTINKKYEIIIKEKSIISFINKEKKFGKKIFIIIDNKLKYIIDNIKENYNTKIVKISGGEKIKSIEHYTKTTLELLKKKIDRDSTIIAIGGGSIGDLSGYITSTILRGVKFILIPTTLLSQVDSSIGGKNGINTIYGKNLIGTFFHPDKVIIDTSVLASLSKREIKSGYAEILKHALIKNKDFYSWLSTNFPKIIKLDKKFITHAITESIKIKKFFVESDEKEHLKNSSSRAMLNFGHTFGHALETLSKFNKLTHGEAISIGMAVESKISKNMKLISEEEYTDLINHLKDVGLPFEDSRISSDKFFNLMLSDKKNTHNKINLVLLKNIGLAFFNHGMTKKQILGLII